MPIFVVLYSICGMDSQSLSVNPPTTDWIQFCVYYAIYCSCPCNVRLPLMCVNGTALKRTKGRLLWQTEQAIPRPTTRGLPSLKQSRWTNKYVVLLLISIVSWTNISDMFHGYFHLHPPPHSSLLLCVPRIVNYYDYFCYVLLLRCQKHRNSESFLATTTDDGSSRSHSTRRR